MVVSCWVNGCTNRADGTLKIGFYSIPTVRENEGHFTRILTEERRRQWLVNINRTHEPTKYAKICSEHFVHGQPAKMYERDHPDWAPTVKLCTTEIPTKSLKRQRQGERASKRLPDVAEQKTTDEHHAAQALLDLLKTHEPRFSPATTESDVIPKKCCKFTQKGHIEITGDSEPVPKKPFKVTHLEQEVQRLLAENARLKLELNQRQLTQEIFLEDDKGRYHAGVPTH